ncbi:MAG: hypothetical protein ABW250_02590 [Pyrinomonadaceae bacterium]
MLDFNKQATEIRRFLLGRLPEESAEHLEERIFADRDFAEEVEIAESELIADYHENNLGPEDRALFERKYLTSPANIQAVDYESAFREFIRGKLKEEDPLHRGRLGLMATSPAGSEAKVSPAQPEHSKHGLRFSWLRRFFVTRPLLANLTAAVSLLLLLAVGFWKLSAYLTRPPAGDPAQTERRAIEGELARLNTAPSTSLQVTPAVTVDLQPVQRGVGAMSRLRIGDFNRSSFIRLRLGLIQSGPVNYRAAFLDDRRNELFVVEDLTAQNTPEGPQVQLLVPAKYFKPGDYQISLSALNRGGSYEEVNSYALRVIEAKQ